MRSLFLDAVFGQHPSECRIINVIRKTVLFNFEQPFMCAAPIFSNIQNFLSAVPVANTFALWYNKSKELEEFQNNYAVKFPFAIASSSPGPRPKQQKGSAIP